jgi:hypothetical protein
VAEGCEEVEGREGIMGRGGWAHFLGVKKTEQADE